MSAPLTNGQKAYLAQLATRAFNFECAKAHGRGETPDTSSATRETFRHQEVIKACGKNGLRCCSQDDYKLIEAHFLELLGQHAQAFNAQVRAATEDKRLVEYKIVQACKEFGFAMSYADKICRAQNKGAGLQDVSEKTLWTVFYTIRNRGLKRQRERSADFQSA